MKKMIIALMVLGFGNYSAEAKKKCVCKNEGSAPSRVDEKHWSSRWNRVSKERSVFGRG